jgi:hypothetical protein
MATYEDFQQVDSVGYRAWDEFYLQMDQRFSLGQSRGQYWQNRFYKTFIKIAQICIKHHIDVTDYIRVNFDTVGKNHRYITPADFAKEEAVKRYLKYKTEYLNESLNSWSAQERMLVDLTMKCVPEVYPSMTDMLMNHGLTFRAWFRIFYPDELDEKLMVEFGQTAWGELREDRQLRAFLRKSKPDRLLQLETAFGKFTDHLME